MVFFSCACKAQRDKWSKMSNSLAIISRVKADTVLSKIGVIHGTKLLYSLRDRDYYLIIKVDNCYREYYISTDSLGNLTEMRTLKSRNKDRKLMSQAFELNKYHSGFITKMANATYLRGEPSYFTVKDETGKRYGEYSLFSLTLPSPIDGGLYAYLLRRTIEESAKQARVDY